MPKLIYTEEELPQKSSEWLEKRKLCIGGSDIAAVIGANPYESGKALWFRKTGRTPPKQMNEAMLRGIEMEVESHNSIKLHLIKEGIKNPQITPLFALHPKDQFLGVSFDGVDIENQFITEIKCPLSVWNFKKVIESGVQGYYYPQVQLQLHIANAHWDIDTAYFCSYYPDGAYILRPLEFTEYLETLAVVKVTYNPLYCQAMAEVGKLFWEFLEEDYWDQIKYDAAVDQFNKVGNTYRPQL